MRTSLPAALAAIVLGSCCAQPAPKVAAVAEPTPPDPEIQLPPPVEEPPAVTKPFPATRRDDIVDTLHGQAVADPYRWLEDAEQPEVKAWMDAQDAYARGELAKLPGKDAIAARLREVFYFDALGAPTHRKGRFFFTRKHADKEKNVVYWKQGAKGADQVLFDPNTWSTDGSSGLGGWWPSRSGGFVAYAKKENNADETVTYVRDLATGKDLPDVIPGTKYSGASWTPDDKGFYYTWVPPVGGDVTIANRPGFAELRYHALGTDPAKDPVIHGKTGNPQTFLGGSVSWDGKWLVATVQHGWNSSDLYFKDARKPAAPWTPLVEGVAANFEITVWKDRFYVNTNDGAPRYRVFAVDPRKPARADWKEIVPQSADTLESIAVIGDKLVLSYLHEVQSALAIHDLTGKRVRAIDLPPLGTASGLTGNPDEDTAYFTYASFTEAAVTYQASIKTGATKEWSRVKLPIDTSGMVAEQVRYTSKDGTSIPMFLLHRKDAVKDGKNRVQLYGYGGFNVSLTPGFSSARAVWLERGGMIAIPNLRGGGEFGEDWHKAGMGANKQNVFDDFQAAARYLIDQGWTSPEHLAIYGGSNGGLLVGATMTQAPELFGAVVCAVPLLDMVRYHQFGSGATWVPEYGSADDPAQFKTLFAYSPYHHVVDGTRYPALLMLSSDHDDRVDPMHARKFIAAVQHAIPGDRPAWLRIEKNAGHGGADAVKQAVEQNADLFAFLERELQ
ncbi:MAG: S9 family peptidase [Myxococcales bacterium]|nr:S9 family peptidase [Myxococcales bacterium]